MKMLRHFSRQRRALLQRRGAPLLPLRLRLNVFQHVVSAGVGAGVGVFGLLEFLAAKEPEEGASAKRHGWMGGGGDCARAGGGG